MEAEDVLKTNRSAFDNELNDLISGAVHPGLSTSPHGYSPQPPPSKRLKAENGSHDIRYPCENDDLVHKRSKVLQDFTNIPRPRFASPDKNLVNGDGLSMHKPPIKALRFSPRSSRSGSSYSTTSPGARPKIGHLPRNDIAYEQLLDQRRREKLQKVDRYVPEYRSPSEPAAPSPSRQEGGAFPLSRLPEAIIRKILEASLVQPNPIAIDISSHRSIVKEYARVPSAMQKVHHDRAVYLLPVPYNELNRQIGRMREDIQRSALDLRERNSNNRRSPCRGLAIALLRVSRGISSTAAEVFYGMNVFNFPCPTSAWMQLDSFLATIGVKNVARIQQIRIHVPLWHRGIHEDLIEGSLIDVLSPVSRLKAPNPSSHDRLLSVIQRATATMIASTPKPAISLVLENSITADYWTGRYKNDKRLLSLSDVEEYIERKKKGVACLKEMSDMLTAASKRRPRLTLSPVLQCGQADKKEFRQRFAGLVEEAVKYGWEVEPNLGLRR